MTNGVEGALYIMITVVISVLIMMQFAVPVGSFVNKHPSIQIWFILLNLLALCCLQKVLTYQMH
jgi:predicted tellurium resistance membrane protein TerC